MTLLSGLHRQLRNARQTLVSDVRRRLAVRYGAVAPWSAGEVALVHDTVEAAVGLALLALDGRPDLPPDLREACREIGAAAARHRRPPSEVAAYPAALAQLLQAQLWAHAGPGDHLVLTGLSVALEELVVRAATVVAEAYFAQLRRDGFLGRSSRTLAEDAVRGRLTPDALLAAGRRPTLFYEVVVVRGAVDLDVPVAIGNLLVVAPHVLHHRSGADQVLVVPADTVPDVDGAVELLEGVPELVDSALVAVRAAGLEDLPAAVAEAHALAAEAMRLGRTGRVWRRDDLLVETRLSLDPRASARLRSIVRPLDDEPELVRTLQVLYRNDLDRTRTARDLGIARRTLAYRTQRAGELTGLHPTSTRGVQVLGPALAVLRFRDHP